MAGRRTGYWWVAAAAALVAFALTAALALTRPWADAGDLTPEPTPPPPPVAVLPAASTDAPAPTAAGVRAAIDALVRDPGLGGRVSAAVVDAVTADRLYHHDPDAPLVPASTVKLVTAATLLATLGPAYQLATVAVTGAEPGEVVLVGGGDPTLAVDETGFYPQAARLDQLVAQVRERLGDLPITKVTVDASLFAGGVHGPWDADIPGSGFVGPITALMTDGGRVDPDPEQGQRAAPRWEEPALAAGEAFASLLGVDPSRVARGTGPTPAAGAGPTPAEPNPASPNPASPNPAEHDPAEHEPAELDPAEPGAELGRVLSPPVLRLVELMLATSDNVVAEALARQVALAQGEPATFAGAAAAMAAVLDKLGVPLGEGALADGSGLSRVNRLSAAVLTELLAAAADPAAPSLADAFAGLPVAGWSGTLAGRYRTPQPEETGPGAGAVRAKTGSLTGVSALAGWVVTAEGRLLAFAVLADDVPADQVTARTVLDRIGAALATCGCR